MAGGLTLLVGGEGLGLAVVELEFQRCSRQGLSGGGIDGHIAYRLNRQTLGNHPDIAHVVNLAGDACIGRAFQLYQIDTDRQRRQLHRVLEQFIVGMALVATDDGQFRQRSEQRFQLLVAFLGIRNQPVFASGLYLIDAQGQLVDVSQVLDRQRLRHHRQCHALVDIGMELAGSQSGLSIAQLVGPFVTAPAT